MTQNGCSIQAQISEVEREIAMRLRVYPGLVFRRKMKQGEADMHLAIMRAALETLIAVRDGVRP